MNAILVRVGIDQAFGGWNAPVAASGRFAYVPIPEAAGTAFHPDCRRPYREVMRSLADFPGAASLGDRGLLPVALHGRDMHLDPDFSHLTYGDVGARRGKQIAALDSGDLLVFYAGLRPLHECGHKLLYALIGLYVVEEVVAAADVPPDRHHENAHTRKLRRGPSDIVVRARAGVSGRLDHAIPIGEWRDRSYRVRRDLLDAWGGLSVRDGFIQRSAVPPRFVNAARFYDWFGQQKVSLVRENFR